MYQRPDSCFCHKTSSGVFNIHVGSPAQLKHSNMLLQAVILTKDAFKPLVASTNIGRIPKISKIRQNVSAVYQVNDHEKQNLLQVQTVTVSSKTFTTIKICVLDKFPEAVLKIKLDDHEMRTSSSCVTFSYKYVFVHASTYKLVFSIQAETGFSCEVSTLNMKEDKEEHYLHVASTNTKTESMTAATTIRSPTVSLPTKIDSSLASTNVTKAKRTTISPLNGHTTSTTTTRSTKLATALSDVVHTSQPFVSWKSVCGYTESNQYVQTTLSNGHQALCDTQNDGGGWLIIQRRTSDEVDFYRNWTEYSNGFGNLSTNFWLGLNTVHQLCFKVPCELRIDLNYSGNPYNVDESDNGMYYAKYNQFRLSSECKNFMLLVSGYSGNAGDSLAWHDGMAFSTYDQDNDVDGERHCARVTHGAWWYRSCSHSNLNGKWAAQHWDAIRWDTLTGWNTSANITEIKVRSLE